MSQFFQALTEKQNGVAQTYSALAQFAKRQRHFTALENRIRKICPRHAAIEISLAGGSSHNSIAFYITDTKTKSPKDLAHVLYKLERLNGNMYSTIDAEGNSISYSNALTRHLDKKTLYVSINYCWHRPSDSTCQLIVTGQREVESYQMVKRQEPIYQVVCP